MEDMAWVLYALLGTQVILIVVGLMGLIALDSVQATISLISKQQDVAAEIIERISGNVYQMRARLPGGRGHLDELE